METMKRNWESPVKEVQVFAPQEYVAACFTYTANLECAFGAWHKANHTTNVDATVPSNGCVNSNNWENPNRNLTSQHDGLHHGAACAESVVTVTVRNNQETIIGHEGADKQSVDLTSVNIPGVKDVSEVGQTFSNCTWISASKYIHFGSGEVIYFSREANAS